MMVIRHVRSACQQFGKYVSDDCQTPGFRRPVKGTQPDTLKSPMITTGHDCPDAVRFAGMRAPQPKG